jgi:multiple sugar transport system permease protein
MERKMKNMHKFFWRIILALGVLFYFFIFIFPFLVEFSVALKVQKNLFSFPSSMIPRPAAFENFIEVWKLSPLGRSYLNTYYVIITATIINFVVSLPAAYALSALEFPFKKIVTSVAFAAQMFMPILVIVPIFRMLKVINLLDNLNGLALTGMAFNAAFVTLLLKGFFDTIPKEIEEAALIDGCNRISTMLRIYFPLTSAGIVIAVIYNTINLNNEFLFANTFINSSAKNTISVTIFRLLKGQIYAPITWNYVMVAAIYASLPIQIMFILIRRHLTKGVIAGAIK